MLKTMQSTDFKHFQFESIWRENVGKQHLQGDIWRFLT